MNFEEDKKFIPIFTFLTLTLAVMLYGESGMVNALYPPPVCRSMAPVPDPYNCTNYYQCFLIPGMFIQMHFSCPTGGIWDKKYMACVEGTCEGGPVTAPAPAAPRPTPPKPKPRPVRPAVPARPTTKPVTTKRPPRPEVPAAPGSIVTTRKPSGVAPPTSNPGLYKCPGVGQFPHPSNPSKYHLCVVHKGRFYYYVHSCPPTTCYDLGRRLCTSGSCPKELSL